MEFLPSACRQMVPGAKGTSWPRSQEGVEQSWLNRSWLERDKEIGAFHASSFRVRLRGRTTSVDIDMAGYDVLVVGTRCSGAPLCLMLAQRGIRVLGIDRAHFPSDTVSTHFMWPRATS